MGMLLRRHYVPKEETFTAMNPPVVKKDSEVKPSEKKEPVKKPKKK